MKEMFRWLYLTFMFEQFRNWLLGIGGEAMLFGVGLFLVACDICHGALSERGRSRTGETKPNETESTYDKCDPGNRK